MKLVALLSLIALNAWTQPLPNWIDHSREMIDKSSRATTTSPLMTPPETFRLPAEYEPAKAVVFGWRAYTSMLEDIAQIAAKDGNVEIWAAQGPSSIPGVPSSQYTKLPCSLNTVWIRDYGPFGITETPNELAIVDSIYRHYQYRRYDDRLPNCAAESKDIESYGLDLILDGGNLMVDSSGNLFMTNRTYIWNRNFSKEEVDQKLKDYFNVHTIHVIEYAGSPGSPADGTGHIDMLVKLLADDVILITETSSSSFNTAAEEAYNYFKSIKAPNGKDYKIIRVKGWSSGRTWYTYTNSLIVNNVVIIPLYRNYPEENRAAIAAYKEGMPNHKIKGVYSDSSIGAGGSIHCVTQLIPAL